RTGTITGLIQNKKALTQYDVLDSVPSNRFGRLNLVLLQPLTGRRHQLRIHMARLGQSILGDRDYTNESLLLKGKGMFLHALALEFIHPFTNEKLHIVDAIPERFLKIFPEFEFKAS
ncbi:MAG: pseudouridine synthase, partial [Marinirhabdus sp.]|nr:pseudouridine synthase [Marinirhabdus sp.]